MNYEMSKTKDNGHCRWISEQENSRSVLGNFIIQHSGRNAYVFT